jgi:hypothetical protein
MWEKIEWFGDLAKRSSETSPELCSPSDGPSRPFTSDTIKGHSFALLAFFDPHSAPPPSLVEYTLRHPDEDVISFISYASVKSDVSKQWVPFGTPLLLSDLCPSFHRQESSPKERFRERYSAPSL